MIKNLFLAAFVLLFSSNVFLKAVEWQPNLLFGDRFFPSFALANSTYKTIVEELSFDKGKDSKGQIGVEMMHSSKDYTLKIKISCDEIMFPTEASIKVTDKNKTFIFTPKIDYKWDALRNNEQSKPITIKITTWINGKLLDTKMKTVTLQSINNCPYTCISKQNEIIDLNYMYAAYVDEDNPVITNVLLKEMFAQGAIKSISAYQSGSSADVYRQVFAVWNMLQKRGISYSSLGSSGNRDDLFTPIVFHQYVRTVEDALNNEQANCVDGTVLMASILYRMGIQPYITMTPTHCYLGYDLGDGSIQFLETTMIGSEPSLEDIAFIKTSPTYDANLSSNFGKAYDSFMVATAYGNMNYQKDREHFNNYSKLIELSIVDETNRMDLVNKLQYQLYPVKKYKDRGLQSIYK